MLQLNIQQNGHTREITKLIRRLLWSSSMYAATYLKKLPEVFKTKLKRIKLNTDGIQFIAKGILLIFRILWYHMTSRKRTTRKRTTLCFPSCTARTFSLFWQCAEMWSWPLRIHGYPNGILRSQVIWAFPSQITTVMYYDLYPGHPGILRSLVIGVSILSHILLVFWISPDSSRSLRSNCYGISFHITCSALPIFGYPPW